MLRFNFHTEEKVTKTQKHKQLTFTFEKKSSKIFSSIIKFIKSFL